MARHMARHAKYGRGSRRWAALLAAGVLFALAVTFGSRQGRVLGQAPFEVTGGVDAAQCASCHQRIAGARNPDLIFNHGFHLLIACEDCHWEYPHKPDQTIRPSMESCFNCHGLSHGSQGVFAQGGCRTCHPASFDKRPADHTRAWAGKPHVSAAKADMNRCSLCHQQPFCEACHRRKGVPLSAHVLRPYVSYLPEVTTSQPVSIDPDAPVGAGQCVPCHANFDRFRVRGFEKDRLIFAHEAHLSRGFSCRVCHPRFPHRPDGIDRPPMRICYDCHGVIHGKQGLVASTDCGLCHPKAFDLMPRDHRPQGRWLLSHGKPAKQDLEYCQMCHDSGFCEPCHLGKKPLPASVAAKAKAQGIVAASGPSAGKVLPKDHRSQQWRTRHGEMFMKLDGSCSPCHSGGFCYRCHKTGMPHPPNWLQKHSAKGVGREDCNVCHQDRSTCQQCHHGGIVGGRLVPESCVKCHPEAAVTPYTAIRSKGMIVHAAHWRKKYRCLQCHIGFEPELRPVDRAHSYSFDLCRECHGALDRNRQVIAEPRVGVELCRKCHPNLAL